MARAFIPKHTGVLVITDLGEEGLAICGGNGVD